MSLIGQFIVYGLGGALSRLGAIFLVPLYTRTLSIDEFGYLELALAVQTLVVLLAGLQVESAVARDINEARACGQRLQMIYASLFLTILGSTVAALLLALVASYSWAVGYFSPSLILIIAALALPSQLLNVQLVILRFEGRARAYAVFSILELLLTALFSIMFIVYFKWGVEGALLGMLVAKTVISAMAWPLTMRGVAICGAQRDLIKSWGRRLVAYGVPGLPAAGVNWMQNMGARLFLVVALSVQDVAIVGLAIKVAAVFGFIIYSFRLAWEPHSIARIEHHIEQPFYFRYALEWYMIGMLPVVGVVLATIPWIVKMFAPEEYSPATSVAIAALVAHYWVGVTNMAVIGIQGARQMHYLLPVYTWGAVTSILVLFLLSPFVGPMSASIGLMSGAVVTAALSARISNKVFGTQFQMRLLYVALVATIILVGVLSTWLALVGSPAHNTLKPVGAVLHGATSWVVVCMLLAFGATCFVALFGVGLMRVRCMFSECVTFIRPYIRFD